MKLIYPIATMIAFTFLSCDYNYYYKRGNYREAFHSSTRAVFPGKHPRMSVRKIKRIEAAFNKANQADLQVIDSLLGLSNDVHLPDIHQYYLQLQQREQTLKVYLPMRNKYGYTPLFQFVAEIDSLEAKSRLDAANYLYNQAVARSDSATAYEIKELARSAHKQLCKVKKDYFPNFRDLDQEINRARETGTIHILMVKEEGKFPSEDSDFWSGLKSENVNFRSDWVVVHFDSTENRIPDYTVKCRVRELYISSRNEYSVTTTETVKVEDGVEETRDSSGQVIARTIKYREKTVEHKTYYAKRDGRCSVDMTIYRGSSDEELFNKMIESCYTYSKESTMHPISAPSDWTMVDHVVSDWESSFRLWAKRTIKL